MGQTDKLEKCSFKMIILPLRMYRVFFFSFFFSGHKIVML